MRIVNASGLPEARVESIAHEARRPGRLEDLLAIGRQDPSVFVSPAIITDVVIQDEFTHDVIVRRTDGLVLVYDST